MHDMIVGAVIGTAFVAFIFFAKHIWFDWQDNKHWIEARDRERARAERQAAENRAAQAKGE